MKGVMLRVVVAVGEERNLGPLRLLLSFYSGE